MANGTHILKGIVRGRTIELEQDSGLPNGQAVAVTLSAATPRGDGLQKSFGSWRDDAEALDEFLDELRRDRQHDRDIQR